MGGVDEGGRPSGCRQLRTFDNQGRGIHTVKDIQDKKPIPLVGRPNEAQLPSHKPVLKAQPRRSKRKKL